MSWKSEKHVNQPRVRNADYSVTVLKHHVSLPITTKSGVAMSALSYAFYEQHRRERWRCRDTGGQRHKAGRPRLGRFHMCLASYKGSASFWVMHLCLWYLLSSHNAPDVVLKVWRCYSASLERWTRRQRCCRCNGQLQVGFVTQKKKNNQINRSL